MESKILTSESTDDSIPLARRIKEILHEKGDAFTVPAFSKRIGMSESTLYRCVDGKRTIKPTELQKIADGLNVSISRLKQDDIKMKLIQLKSIVRHKVNLHQALDLAHQLLPLAIGCTERFEVTNCLGAVHYHQKKYKAAVNTWLTALPHAEKIYKEFTDSQPLLMTMSNLINSYTEMKDFSSMYQVLRNLEERFTKTPLPTRLSASISYAQAVAAYEMGDLEEYKQKMYEQLSFFQATGIERSIAIAHKNVAHMLYNTRDYKRAKTEFKKTLDYIAGRDFKDAEFRFRTLKDLIKTLCKLREPETTKLLDRTLEEIEPYHFPETTAKLLLLRAIYTGHIESAEVALNLEHTSTETRGIACKMLMDYCSRNNDSIGLMKYYKIGGDLKPSPISELEELL